MIKKLYKAPVSEEAVAIMEEILADSVTGSYETPDLTEEPLTW